MKHVLHLIQTNVFLVFFFKTKLKIISVFPVQGNDFAGKKSLIFSIRGINQKHQRDRHAQHSRQHRPQGCNDCHKARQRQKSAEQL